MIEVQRRMGYKFNTPTYKANLKPEDLPVICRFLELTLVVQFVVVEFYAIYCDTPKSNLNITFRDGLNLHVKC